MIYEIRPLHFVLCIFRDFAEKFGYMKAILRSVGVSFALACFVFLYAAAVSAQSGYHLLDKIQVGGEGGWDILIADPGNHRVYVSHASHVVAIDTTTDKVVGDIPKTNGVHGIAFGPEYGFTTNGRDNAVTMFSLKDLSVSSTIPTGKNPDAIVYDKPTNRIFAFNGGSDDATVIDAATGKVAGTIPLGGKPEFGVSDDKGKVYVNLEDKNSIAELDAKKMSVLATWAIAPCDGPSGLAIDRKSSRLFAACEKQMVAVDAKTGKVVATVPTGTGTDGMEFDSELKYVFAPNGGDGTLTVIHEDSPDKYSVVENVKTEPRARTMTIDTKTHKLYLPTAQFGTAPAPTKEQPRPRAPMIPNSFVVLVYGR
jgi:YVTN family beta-propeller protein